MNRILLFLLCTILSAPIFPAVSQNKGDEISFDPQSVKTWMGQNGEVMKRKEGNADLSTVLRRTVEFRQAMAVDTKKAIEEFAENPHGFEMVLKSPVNQEVPQVWNYFFSTSIVLIGNALSESPLVAYYNPFLDAVAYVQWKSRGGEVVPEKMAVDSFEATDDNQESVPRWISNGGTPMALLKEYQAFRTGFESKHHFKNKSPATLPDINSQEIKREILEARSLRALFELATVLRSKDGTSIQNAWDVFHKAMRDGDRNKVASMLPDNNVMSSQQIMDIPQTMRAQLSPVFVIVGEKESLLYQQVESAPKFTAVFRVENDVNATSPMVESFAFFDLDARAR